MTIDDLDAVMKIEREGYAFPWSIGIFRDCLRAGYHCLVLERRNCLMGYGIISIGAGEAQLLNLCIRRKYRAQGLGRWLLGHLIDVAGRHNADSMFLEVRPSNRAALRLYQRMGFNEVGVRKGYYPGKNGPDDAIILGLALFQSVGEFYREPV
uniref:[Ribosomal protein bS18]-alanine N-acetyltransferase n=1 Tax=Candidatus Kentrum sp. TC TaxID=2126339 RepID=A0A450ZW69_9GAMM|nr:MAG: ribosomal-protein-alanine N-acetyltransferase [Candidatus Kentron sp. TC]VFK44872.1 MAG: [SSU ribosomal protein S18P]-alanine acetyltransferase [Candidatus Kentron sp. TC]VFK58003.1 MAG: ribosomal-protein-alanine N-acetyltransferase [Candidatus Kentron sp. TC]